MATSRSAAIAARMERGRNINGGSRKPPFYIADFDALRPSAVSALDVAQTLKPSRGPRTERGLRIKSAIRPRSVDDAVRRSQSDNQEHKEQQQEQARQELRDRERRDSDCREAQQSGNEPNNEEYQSHVEHDFNLLL